jgi:NAD kinase
MKLKPVGNSYSQALKGNVITFLQSSLGQLNHFGIQNVEETLTEMIVVHFVSPFRAKLELKIREQLTAKNFKQET